MNSPMLNRFLIPALIIAFVPVCTFAQSKGQKDTLPDSVEAIRGIEYSRPDGHALLLDVLRPKQANGPTPVVVFVHGGGWKNGSRNSGEKNGAWLVDEGFAIVSIDYRLTGAAQWPAQIDDCYEAVRWVRRNAQKYNFDPHHIAAWGTSAGGHLVALMGTRTYPDSEDVSSRVQAVCDWFGPSELLTMPPNNVGNDRHVYMPIMSGMVYVLDAAAKRLNDKALIAINDLGLFHVQRVFQNLPNRGPVGICQVLESCVFFLAGQDLVESRPNARQYTWRQALKGFGINQETARVAKQPSSQVKLPQAAAMWIE